MTYDRREIFRTAHFNARLKKFGRNDKSYQDIFAACLRAEYAWARRKAEMAANAAKRQAERDDANLNGIPLASCGYDRRPLARIIPSRSMSMGQ